MRARSGAEERGIADTHRAPAHRGPLPRVEHRNLNDVRTMVALLKTMGREGGHVRGRVDLDASQVTSPVAGHDTSEE